MICCRHVGTRGSGIGCWSGSACCGQGLSREDWVPPRGDCQAQGIMSCHFLRNICGAVFVNLPAAGQFAVKAADISNLNAPKHAMLLQKQDAAGVEQKESLLQLLVKNVLKNPYIWGMALTYFFIYVVRQGVTSWFVFYLMKVFPPYFPGMCCCQRNEIRVCERHAFEHPDIV